MSKQLVYLAQDDRQLEDYSELRSQIVFGNESLKARLFRQLSKLQKKLDFELVQIRQDQLLASQQFDQALVFFEHIAYSESLLIHLIENGYYYNSQSANFIKANTNHTISADSDTDKLIHFPYDSQDESPVVNQKLLGFPLNLPRGIYPDNHYEVALTNYFYQPLNEPKDLLKIQSCIVRESTADVVRNLKPFLSSRLIEKMMNNSFLAQFSNRIGKNCKIHSTAILESCVVGDNVEIGPYCYLRGAVVGDDVVIREGSSIKVAVIGRGSYIVPTDIFNCYIGENCNIVTHILFHTVIGSKTFVGGGVGFADFKFNADPIHSKDQIFFGAVVGEESFIGAGLLFQAGITIPRRTKMINYDQISFTQFKPDQIYVAKGSQVTQIPKNFLDRAAAPGGTL